ncbi:hypothetical protein F7734_37900 [Scytonema sp. UIC 10036]|uniref:hypothetical protein n=1 Tax=Scytonema sp. UIC 10036 TaxID=2304196 RepID=UPI0012DA2C67|nr:hypothetical protein [Scytonema sp. UIC 10036]MUG97777.1 hypothetical protein [Scytonema sp. UIC 10036]
MQETVVEQNQKYRNDIKPLLYNRNDAYVQINPVQEQATKLWTTLSKKDTADAYQKAGATTWTVLKQAIALLVFSVVLLVALIFWVWGIGFQAGFQFRQWLEVKQPNLDEVIALVLKILLWPFVLAFQWANWFVKNYLGLEIRFEQPKPPSTPAPPSGGSTDSTSTPSQDSPTK